MIEIKERRLRKIRTLTATIKSGTVIYGKLNLLPEESCRLSLGISGTRNQYTREEWESLYQTGLLVLQKMEEEKKNGINE